MTEATSEKPETPVAEKAAAPAKAPEPPAEPPFNIDALKNCTSRFTRQAWDLFLIYSQDLNIIQTAPVRFALTARSAEGAQEIHGQLKALELPQMTLKAPTIEFTGTFADLQTVVKHPQTLTIDAIRL